MRHQEYFYNCSPEYVEGTDRHLREEVLGAISRLRKRQTQLELNQDIVWLLGSHGWDFSAFPKFMPETPPADLGIGDVTKKRLKTRQNKKSCLASTILEHKWEIDFSKTFGKQRVYLEAQFGKKEAALMDVCKLRIAYCEKHLSLGIEVVLSEPNEYFSHRRGAVTGMAKFSVVKEILPVIGVDCPIWLIGLEE